jgi:hypothetical protein
MSVSDRCNNAGPLGKIIPTRSIVAFVIARLQSLSMPGLRW